MILHSFAQQVLTEVPIDETLSSYSDVAFQTAFALYAVAMVAAVVYYAMFREPRAAAQIAAGVRQTGYRERPDGDVLIRSTSLTGTGEEYRHSDRGASWAKIALLFTSIAFVFHAASVLLRGLATDRMPLGNMYEFISFTCLLAIGASLTALRKPALRTAWPFILAPILILLFFRGTNLYSEAAPVVPALRSYWLPIHVSIIGLGAALFLVSGIASVLYLLRIWQPKGQEHGRFAGLARPLPADEILDRVAYRTAVIGFPIFSVGVILGAVWAEGAWGRFWGWDPKETVSFISWVIYAGYLHARSTSGWGPKRAAWINILGFATTVFNLFFINIVVSGLHSYAGLN